MNKKIKAMFDSLGIPSFFVASGEDRVYPQVVYNYMEYPWIASDSKEDGIEYSIDFHLLNNGDFMEYKEKIISLLLENGFIRSRVGSAEYISELDCYTLPMRFKYYVEYSSHEEVE